MNNVSHTKRFNDVIADLVKQITNDQFYSKIICTKAFQRLKHISFLGAINYVRPFCLQKKGENSRLTHSLWVAGLAKHISNIRKYDREIEKHIVTAALLHDIGHGPLSHSVEPVFKERWGVGHHQIGQDLIFGKKDISKSLYGILKQNLDVNQVVNLIDGRSSDEFVDLFSSPINIDTVDGITRSYRCLRRREDYHYNLLEIVEASFVKTTRNREKILDDFWRLKNNIYRIFILSSFGFKADVTCQIYLKENILSFDRDDLISNELKWKKKHSSLFETLASHNWGQRSDLVEKYKDLKVHKRKYSVDQSIKLDDEFSMKKRYNCKKHSVKFTQFPAQMVTGL